MLTELSQEKMLEAFSVQLEAELENILHYWVSNTPDTLNGGFVGRIDEHGRVDHKSPKGSVLNARILWSFAAGYNFKGKEVYLEYANRAYQYINDYFIDKKYGGVFWTVDSQGNPLDTKKQVYAIAFTIYGMAEYYRASGLEKAKATAIELYKVLEQNSYDKEQGGYFEAFSRDWKSLNDFRLSKKDANEKKTMNTHLHILEAYTNLYRVWPVEELKVQIENLLQIFLDKIIDKQTNHLILFFDEYWNHKYEIISFGHDIEASWLLLEAAEVTQNFNLIEETKIFSTQMAAEAVKGMDADGGMWYEGTNECLVKEKHWWVQAEAMIGFVNAWQLSSNDSYLKLALSIWSFINARIIDKKYGEWHWGISPDGEVMPSEDKVGIWKCPYHNSRACIEVFKRLKVLLENQSLVKRTIR